MTPLATQLRDSPASDPRLSLLPGRPTARGIPSLDGLRAISIGLVLLGHSATGGSLPYLPSLIAEQLQPLADLGVRVFFVISGFLITTLLLRELDSSGNINVGRFYVRRALRIFPPFYAYVAVLLLLSAASVVHLPNGLRDVVAPVTYTTNYVGAPWVLNHSWSLSVEEQFYLLWPPILLLGGRTWGTRTAFAVVALCPVARLALAAVHAPQMGFRFEFVADGIATGALLALIGERLDANSVFRAARDSKLFTLAPLLIVGATFSVPGPTAWKSALLFLVGITFLNVAIALCIDRWVRHPDGRAGRLLNSAPLTSIGVLSYSIYIWQQLFFDRASQWALAFPLNVAAALGVAVVAYAVIERPSLRLRTWLDETLTNRRPAATDRPGGGAMPGSFAQDLLVTKMANIQVLLSGASPSKPRGTDDSPG